MRTHTDLSDQTLKVSTYGGIYHSESVSFNSFGICIGDNFSFEVNSETALELVNMLSNHLETSRIKP